MCKHPRPNWYRKAQPMPLLCAGADSHKSGCHDSGTCHQSGLSSPDYSSRDSWKLSRFVDFVPERPSPQAHCEVWTTSKVSKHKNLHHRLCFSIFLICLYCADTSFLLSGYLGQWVINISGFNLTGHVDYISIRYDNESSMSTKYLYIMLIAIGQIFRHPIYQVQRVGPIRVSPSFPLHSWYYFCLYDGIANHWKMRSCLLSLYVNNHE